MDIDEETKLLYIAETGIMKVAGIESEDLQLSRIETYIEHIRVVWMKVTKDRKIVVQQSESNDLLVYDLEFNLIKSFTGIAGVAPHKEIVRTCRNSFDDKMWIWMKGDRSLVIINPITQEIMLEISDMFLKGSSCLPLMAIVTPDLLYAVAFTAKNEKITISQFSAVKNQSKHYSLIQILPECNLIYNNRFKCYMFGAN